MMAMTDSMSEAVIPWPCLRDMIKCPSSGPFTKGQIAAHRITKRIEAGFGFAAHHASEEKRAFIATML